MPKKKELISYNPAFPKEEKKKTKMRQKFDELRVFY